METYLHYFILKQKPVFFFFFTGKHNVPPDWRASSTETRCCSKTKKEALTSPFYWLLQENLTLIMLRLIKMINASITLILQFPDQLRPTLLKTPNDEKSLCFCFFIKCIKTDIFFSFLWICQLTVCSLMQLVLSLIKMW